MYRIQQRVSMIIQITHWSIIIALVCPYLKLLQSLKSTILKMAS